MSVTVESPLVWVSAAFSVACAEGTVQPCGSSSEPVLAQGAGTEKATAPKSAVLKCRGKSV